MPIPIVKEGESLFDAEHCCFCRKPTTYWHAHKDPREAVAVCQECAKVRKVKELPTKKEWCEKERAIWEATHRFEYC